MTEEEFNKLEVGDYVRQIEAGETVKWRITNKYKDETGKQNYTFLTQERSFMHVAHEGITFSNCVKIAKTTRYTLTNFFL